MRGSPTCSQNEVTGQLQRLTIIVSGQMFEVNQQCLENYPDTLLGDPEKREKYLDSDKTTLFFNRHRLAFEGILMYYQTSGKSLMCPDNVPREVFEEELDFFGIQDPSSEKCKAVKYIVDPLPNLEQQNFKSKLWVLLQHPESSSYGQFISAWSFCVTVVSIVLALSPVSDKKQKAQDGYLFPYEHFCFGWFLTEYLLRLWAAPNKCEFCRNSVDLVDLSTILIFYSTFMLSMSNVGVGVLRIFRLANVFRILKLTRYSYGLRLLIYTIYQSRMDMQLLFSCLSVFILVSSSVVYYIERSDKQALMTSIPSAIWWSIISCTTVGYGDVVPITGMGKFFGAITAVFGALMVLMPVLKLVQAFSDALMVSKPHLKKYENKSSKGPLSI